MAVNARFHLLKPSSFLKSSANLSKFPRASHFFTYNSNLRLNRGGGRKLTTIPPLGCNSKVSNHYSPQIQFKSPRTSPLSTISINNYSNLRLNRCGGCKFSTIPPLRSNSENSSSITESSQSIVGDPVAFRNESRTQFHATAMFWKIILVLLLGYLAWAYRGFFPPPTRICGSIGGPSIKGPRIKLRDGRHLSYKEHGVPKETARYKIVLVHGFGSSKHDAPITESELVEKLGIYLVSFDRPGYGESDPDPNRTMKSIALDIEELADQLELGPKFYVIGTSMGGQVVWGCLKYIPHRLAGATLIAPVVNYWWPGFPSDLATEAYYQQFPRDQWALRVAHHAPWLVYWWNTRKWLPGSSVAAGKANFTAPDLEILAKNASRPRNKEYATQQGVYESHHRDLKVGFGHWDFVPMDLDDPFPDGEGSVHLWQGVEDGLVPVSLQRYIVKKLPWIQYHELPDAGHLFTHGDATIKDAILNAALSTGMYWEIILGSLITFLAWAYRSIRPPPHRIRELIQGPRIKLRDGRHLSYKEDGVPKERANYSIIFVHGFGACKRDDSMGVSELIGKLGIHLVHFDRPGYGESDPDPKRTVKSLVLDIEELADQLGLGPKFYIIGASMGGQPLWGCLKYIPHRLAGAALISPVVNYWWPSFPSNLATQAYSKELVQDQWALRVAHYAPWLVYWWNTQKWFPPHSVTAGKPNFTEPDLQLLSKLSLGPVNWEYATQQGVHESLHRDLMVGFGQWEFDPMEVDDPFPAGEGRVHLWQGAEDGLVSPPLQRYIAKKLPWIHYHEVANAGHMFLAETAVKDAVLNALLTGYT